MTDEEQDWDQDGLRNLRDALQEFELDRAYDAAIRRAGSAIRRRLPRRESEEQQLKRAVEFLRQPGPPGVVPRPPGRYGGWALCHAYLQVSFEARYTDPHLMNSLALAAVEVALDTLPESYPPGVVFDLQARAYAELANARRVNNCISEADTYLENAKEFMALGSGDLTLRGLIDELEAALRIEQRRLSEAAELLDRAHDLYLEIGDPHLAGRTLLNRARVAYTGGAPKDVAIGFLERSLTLLDRKRDPQLANTAYHRMILYLTDYGDYQRAGEVLLGSGLGEAFAEQPLNRLRLRWVEAKIHAGMNRLDKAEAAFQEVRAGFREHELEYDAALVGLDLAAVWLRQGKDDRVEPLAVEMRETFTRLSLPMEARKAVVFLATVSGMQLASVATVERTRDFLARLREDPQLVFDVPTTLLG